MEQARDSTASLADVLITEQLRLRPARQPDQPALNRALVELTRQMAESPHHVLQRLVEAAVELCGAHTAGSSILDHEGGRDVFRWHALAGRHTQRAGSIMSRSNSPCGMVLDRHAHLLFRYPERHFPFPGKIEAPLAEVLLTPFYNDRRAVGSIWIIAHDETKKFDACDVHIVTELGRFASSAHSLLTSLGYVQVPPTPGAPDEPRLNPA
jgi:hypothetical protein